ncbi:MAG: extracellular solute-binding protein [Chloroflexi bacterium]|nr:MAG: extracellular solute-binding protein [Chloroflexota bacterium]
MSEKVISRRDVLKLSGSLIAGTLLVGCTSEATEESQTSNLLEETDAPVSSADTTPLPPKKPQGKVVVFHDVKEITEPQRAQFESDYPGITIEFVDREEPARLTAMLAAGTPPDLIRVQAPIIPGYLARGIMKDMTPYFAASTLLKIEDLMPANNYYKAESPTRIGTGKIYGMCKDFSPDFTIFVNKKIFEDAGVPVPSTTDSLTYAQVKEYAANIIQRDGERIVTWGYGYGDDWIDRIWMNCLAELGQSLYTDDFSKIQLTSNEEVRKQAQFYFDLAKENLVANPLNPSPSGWTGDDFTAGMLGMMQYGFWFSAMAESDTTRGQIVMIPAPTWAGKRRNPTMTATGMVMAEEAANPDAAWVLFEWYNGGALATERASSGWGVPALKSMLDLIPNESDFQKQCLEILNGELALETPPLQFNPYLGEMDVANSWKTQLEQALGGGLSFDEMLGNIENEVNLTISDNEAVING